MKFDLHCHTKEGSLDAKTDVRTYIMRLIALGYDGMLITDHNSYKGYETWKKIKSTLSFTKPFIVLKGIEYDTIDAGHYIIVLPEHINLKILELRGLTLDMLEKIVHSHGGILGPAHPYGTGCVSLMNTKIGKKAPHMFHKFDFVEGYNGCEKALSNVLACKLARKYKKPVIAGSDAHRANIIGSAYTIFDQPIRNNQDLIQYINEKKQPEIPGLLDYLVLKENIGLRQHLIDTGFFVYHHLFSILNRPIRTHVLSREYQDK